MHQNHEYMEEKDICPFLAGYKERHLTKSEAFLEALDSLYILLEGFNSG